MAYIGKTPTVGNFQVCDAISVVNGQAAYTLQVGGVNVAPEPHVSQFKWYPTKTRIILYNLR